MSQTMKAIRIHGYGGLDVLRYEDAPMPVPGPEDVLLRVHAAGVNPVDWKIRKGYLAAMPFEMPLILGWDVAGEVVSLGERAAGFQVGDAVFSRPDIRRQGAYAEYMVARASEITKKPATLDWLHAAAVPLAALTAWQAMFDVAHLEAGQSVLVPAGAGGVGMFAVQLARVRGAKVYATCSTRNIDFVRELGAHEVLDYTKQDLSELSNLDVVLDTMGGETQAQGFKTLRRGGALVSVVQAPSAEEAARLGVAGHFWMMQPNAPELAEIGRLIDAGQVKVTLDSVFPLAETAKAHERSESGRARGKIVLQVAG
jgi:NADPH:quinone reductase-like Zn-dependent oxidoreductase